MRVRDEYFEWMYDLVCNGRYSGAITYRKLLILLHDTRFRYSISKDRNRAEDGVDLRRRFALTCKPKYLYDSTIAALEGPCSVLEMMVALAIRCEETIMDDPSIGDRTEQWFWDMIRSLGLGSDIDSRFNERHATDVIDAFLERNYEPDGRGGLFTIRGCDTDLRTIEIWQQLCWYLNTVI